MIRLRPYKISDTTEILSWSLDAYSFYQWSAGVLGGYPLSEEQFYVVQKNMAFVLVDEEELVGFIMMRNPTSSLDHLRFGFVIVNPKYRNKGYGKSMLQLALQYAFKIYKCTKVSLGVFENNPSAYFCYKSVGFKEKETNEVYEVLGEEWNCIEMEIEIDD